MKVLKSLIFLLVLSFSIVSFSFAAEYTIDADHSKVLFTIKHLGISSVSGEFQKFSGSFNFDPQSIEASTANAKIDTSSINTSVAKRDEHLKSPDFLDAAKFPEMTFSSKKITPVSAKRFKVSGDLTLHGVTQEVELDVKLGGLVKDPWGSERAAFTAAAKIDRRRFGVVWNKTLETGGLVVGNDIKIRLEVEGIKKAAETAPSK